MPLLVTKFGGIYSTNVLSVILKTQTRAYAMVDGVNWPDGFCRRDTGWRALR